MIVYKTRSIYYRRRCYCKISGKCDVPSSACQVGYTHVYFNSSIPSYTCACVYLCVFVYVHFMLQFNKLQMFYIAERVKPV